MNTALVQNIRSDDLANLRSFFESNNPLFSSFAPLVQITLIPDANIILSEIRWLALKRKKPGSRPAFLEVLACGTVNACAPDFLIGEVEKNLIRISEEEAIPLEILSGHWKEYRSYIKFIQIDNPTQEEIEKAQDPKDIVYIKLQEKINAPIYSNDSDIPAMKGKLITVQVIATLKDYSRHAAIEYQLKFVGAMSLVVTHGMMRAATELIKVIASQTKKLPQWALWLGAFLVIIAITHPRSRGIAVSWIKSLSTNAQKIGVVLLEFSAPLIEEHNKAQQKTMAAIHHLKEIGTIAPTLEVAEEK